jgi:NADPH:quinone reductase-like Zn-dependent oxidoreductase
MKAATIERFATAAGVHEIAPPQLEDDAVVLRITAAGVSPIDWKNRDGIGEKRTVPLTLGQDVAGVIERVGTAVTRVKAGDRIFGCARDHGSYAEFTKIRDDRPTRRSHSFPRASPMRKPPRFRRPFRRRSRRSNRPACNPEPIC